MQPNQTYRGSGRDWATDTFHLLKHDRQEAQNFIDHYLNLMRADHQTTGHACDGCHTARRELERRAEKL